MGSSKGQVLDARAPAVGEDPQETGRSLSRRRLIRNAGIAGAAAWTAPVIVDSLASPAAAATCPAGKLAYVVLWSPQGAGGGSGLTDRPGGDGAASQGGCDATAPGPDCLHGAGRVLSTAAAISLTHSPTNLSHNINSLSQATVTITLAASSCCVITNVRAHVHRFGVPTGNSSSGDCPPVYCQPATTNGQYLQLVGGAYGTKSVVVAPNTEDEACDIANQENQVHWGSPNTDSGCQASNGFGYTNGQPLGYMIIDLDCTGP
jgi:hypothetical protein